jgi:peptidoglycan/xylan/chitin deacetylase (PgdA/CDA1 family)
MFFDTNIVGSLLPRGTLCFTYDDGPGQTDGDDDAPGPRTAELGAFLAREGVPATFFAVGKFAVEQGAILSGLRARGHLVANHTFSHPSLPAFVGQRGDVEHELAETDRAIREHVATDRIYFRAPYGDWWLRGEHRSNVASALNRSALAADHVGPIGWDIDAGDVGFWRDDQTADECAEAYLRVIAAHECGIVLMHDSTADVEAIRLRNRALGLARRLIPTLRRQGYRFVRLDSVPQVASAARVDRQSIMVARDGSCIATDGPAMPFRFTNDRAEAAVGIVELAADRWALRARHGLFVTYNPDGCFLADAPAIGERETFEVDRRPGGISALRTFDGSYLMRGEETDDALVAGRHWPGDRAVFTIDSSGLSTEAGGLSMGE